jgi:hypothetical protein
VRLLVETAGKELHKMRLYFEAVGKELDKIFVVPYEAERVARRGL